MICFEVIGFVVKKPNGATCLLGFIFCGKCIIVTTLPLGVQMNSSSSESSQCPSGSSPSGGVPTGGAGLLGAGGGVSPRRLSKASSLSRTVCMNFSIPGGPTGAVGSSAACFCCSKAAILSSNCCSLIRLAASSRWLASCTGIWGKTANDTFCVTVAC